MRIQVLLKSQPGYPFGLIIEHAFVLQDCTRVFQKLDPAPNGIYEFVTRDEAIRPYQELKGFEITTHRRL